MFHRAGRPGGFAIGWWYLTRLGGNRSNPGSGFVMLLQVGAELADRLVLVGAEVVDHGHLGAGPVGPGVLIAVGRGHQEMVVRDLDVIPHLGPRDAGRHQADRGRVAVVDFQVLEHGASLRWAVMAISR